MDDILKMLEDFEKSCADITESIIETYNEISDKLAER